MSRRHRIDKLLEHPHVWTARRGISRRPAVATGFAALDAALSGGWPPGQLIELLCDRSGIGELQLLLPALARVTGKAASRPPGRAGARGAHWVVLIAPPHLPYAPAFAGHGLSWTRLLIIRCTRSTDILWSAEQALRSGACAAVLAWAADATDRSLRRLQLAAEADGACLLILFRPMHARQQKSPASVRLALRADGGDRLALHLFRHRGGRPRRLTVRLGREGEWR